MATTLKDTTIAASYADLMKRQASYSATGSRVEIMDDAGVGKDTSLYLDITNQRIGIGTAAPAKQLDISKSTGGELALNAGTDNIAITDGTDLGHIYFYGYDVTHSATRQLGAFIRAEASDAWDTDDYEQSPAELQFFTQDNSTDNTMSSPRLVVGADGNVGIGTDAPGVPLTVRSFADNGNVTALFVYNDDHAGTEIGQSVSISGGVKAADANFVSSGRITFGKDDDFDDTASKDGHIMFETRSANTMASKMIIKHDGKVGIGTSNPESLLHLDQDASDDGLTIDCFNNSAGTEASISLRTSDASNGAIESGDNLGKIFFSGSGGEYSSAAVWKAGAAIYSEADAQWAIDGSGNLTENGARLVFQTADGTGSITDHFEIAANGDLTGTDTAIASISDIRLKKDIEDYTSDALTFISELKPKTFKWKVPERHGNKNGSIYGFIADDVKALDDYWVNTVRMKENDLDYSNVSDTNGELLATKWCGKDTIYVRAIQQMKVIIEELSAKVTALENA